MLLLQALCTFIEMLLQVIRADRGSPAYELGCGEMVGGCERGYMLVCQC